MKTWSHVPLVIHALRTANPEKAYERVCNGYRRVDPRCSVNGYYGAWFRDGIHFARVPWIDGA